MGNICRFTNITEMAAFVAELTRNSIAFTTYSTGSEYIVEITGY